MCEGQHRRYWATGLPGWMRGGGRGGPGWGHRSHGPWQSHGPYAYGAEWPQRGRCECDCGRGEPTAQDELAFLKGEAETLKHYLEGIERRMTELEKAGAAHDTS